MLFHLLSKLYERTGVIIITNLSFSEWASVFGDAKLADRVSGNKYPVSQPDADLADFYFSNGI